MSKNITEAKFIFDSYLITKSSISISAKNVSRILDIQVDLDANIKDANNLIGEIIMSIAITDANKVLDLSVTIEGVFLGEEITKENMNQFVAFNGPAILFPYLRAYLTSLTAQSGINPIVLPTVNFEKKGKALLTKLSSQDS
jgi:preprotein translocase subunit SecB